MRISEQGRQQVRPREFWLSILAAMLLLGGMGVFSMQTGHVPRLPHWVVAAFLLSVCVVALLRFLRYGRSALTLMQVVFLLGYTLFVGSDLMPALGQTAWIKDTGFVLMTAFLVLQWVEFGKRAPSHRQRNSPSEK